MSGDKLPVQVESLNVANFTRGVPPVSGDVIDPDDISDPGVVVISDDSADKAFEEVKAIVLGRYRDMAYDVGKCLLKHFYGDDVERIRSKNPVKKEPFDVFLKKFSNEIVIFSRSWLYASLNLLVDQKDLANCAEYQGLNISSKIEISYLDDKKVKINLAKKICDEHLSIRAIRQYKKSLPSKPVQSKNKINPNTELKRFIKDPFRAEEEFEKLASKEIVEKLSKKKIADLLDSTKERLKQIKQEIEKHNRSAKQLELLLTKLKTVEVLPKKEEPLAGTPEEPVKGALKEPLVPAPEEPLTDATLDPVALTPVKPDDVEPEKP